MKKIVLFAGFFCLLFVVSPIHAQSINNRNWVTFIAEPLNDSLTLHIHSDSSFVTNSKGEVLLRTTCIIKGDTLTLADQGSGEHVCPDMGTYKINLFGTSLTLSTIADPCDGRSQAINGKKWTEVVRK